MTSDDEQDGEQQDRRKGVVRARSVDGPWRVAMRVGHHDVQADEPAALGGEDTAPSPWGLLVASLASCTVITLRMYAEHKGWDVQGCEVGVVLTAEGEREWSVERTVALQGDLDDDQRARLLDVCERTPVTLALKHGLPIATHEVPHPGSA